MPCLTKPGTQPEDVDGMINYARRIEDVKMAALIQEQKNGNNEFRQVAPNFMSACVPTAPSMWLPSPALLVAAGIPVRRDFKLK